MALQSFTFVIFLAVIALVLLIGFLIVATIQNAFFAVAPKYTAQVNSKLPISTVIYIVYGSMFFLIFFLLATAIRKR